MHTVDGFKLQVGVFLLLHASFQVGLHHCLQVSEFAYILEEALVADFADSQLGAP